jgi:hypothetical protein
MLLNARVSIEAARHLLYDTSRIVDLKKGYDLLVEHTDSPSKELRQTAKYYTSLAALLTPMSKYIATEYANQIAYDMLQVHGGTGYMRDFNIERHYRDARITNIYEGTTQLQFVGAIGGVTRHVMNPELDKFESGFTQDFQKPYQKTLRKSRELLDKAIEYIKEKNDHDYLSYHSGRVVDMATKIYTAHLFLKYAAFSEEKRKTCTIYFEREMPEIEKNYSLVTSGKKGIIQDHIDLLAEVQ